MRSSASSSRAPAPTNDTDAGRSPPWLGANLQRLRRERGISLAQLAQHCGLDEALLSSIEADSLDPSITTLWGIATALGVPFGTLVQAPSPDPAPMAAQPVEPRARPGHLKRRSVLPFAPHANQRTEVHELKLDARCAEQAAQYARGTFESLLVTQGRVIVRTGVQQHLLNPGDSLVVPGDLERQYLNPGEVAAVMYAVVSPTKLA